MNRTPLLPPQVIDPQVLDPLVARARSLLTGRRRAILGVAGAPGAGKSTLVEQLLAALRASPPPGCEPGTWVAHVPMDGFHLADVELDRLGRRDRKGAPDTFDAAGYVALLRRIAEAGPETVYAPAFERDLEQPLAGALPVLPQARLVLTEGNYLLLDDDAWRPVRDVVTETWFVRLDEQTRLERLVARHVRFGRTPAAARGWALEVDQVNADLVATSQARADLVVTLDAA